MHARSLLSSGLLTLTLLAGSTLAQPQGPAPRPDQPEQRDRRPNDQRPDQRQERGPDQRPQGDRRPDGPRAGGQPENVESAMKAMNRSLRRLRDQVADPEKKGENLQLVNDFERACVLAKGMPLPEPEPRRQGPDAPQGDRDGPRPPADGPRGEPDRGNRPQGEPKGPPQGPPQGQPDGPRERPDGPPSPERQKMRESYRNDLLQLLKQIVEVEQALTDNRFEDARKNLDKVIELRDEAHRELGVREERRGERGPSRGGPGGPPPAPRTDAPAPGGR